jgi:hypothetical protein
MKKRGSLAAPFLLKRWTRDQIEGNAAVFSQNLGTRRQTGRWLGSEA